MLGSTRSFDIDFREADGSSRPLSIIAGRTNTGKTSVLRFIEYALGAKTFPNHSEVLRQVRSVALELQTPDGIVTLERVLGGNNAILYPSDIDSSDAVTASTFVIDPTGHPDSVSQLLLATVGLQDVKLKESPTQDESGTDRLGFRDVMGVCLYLNERVGSQQLLHSGNFMKELKLRQVVDAIYGVHDNDQAELARRIKEAQAALDNQRQAVELLQEFVAQQQPKPLVALEIEAEDLDKELRGIDEELRALGRREAAASAFASELRQRHAELAIQAAKTDAFVRDRLSLINRFGSLRAQYADDVRKLTLFVEAENAFDQLSVEVCPACFNTLLDAPNQDNGTCSLCHQSAPPQLDEPEEAASIRQDDSKQHARKELRAGKRRYKELDDYWQRLNDELPTLHRNAEAAALAEAEAGSSLDEATHAALTPFLGERNELQRRRQASLVLRSEATNGIKLRTGLEARLTNLDRSRRNLDILRQEQRDKKERPDRDAVLRQISERYAQILVEIQYPKVMQDGVLPPYLDEKLVPYVRNQHFREASSGGQVLVSLAWMLSVFEIAYELNAAHPGVLLIDTPQKNLGGAADDAEFADIHLVERVYAHLVGWLGTAGTGAQVIVVDNTPPDKVEEHVVVRYTRDPEVQPFGLIDNETGSTSVT
ncbi:ATP-binding protein [Pseudarthrobacter sulfonivorans]|uniref:ATP-binding protein n=1 Tax=Pseudarthrobacter sulfonivorans TaxID=121292 RepID=UPI00168BBC50|nr:ATP-binding protein [Pseudarthrobacter sulfonivorans]